VIPKLFPHREVLAGESALIRSYRRAHTWIGSLPILAVLILLLGGLPATMIAAGDAESAHHVGAVSDLKTAPGAQSRSTSSTSRGTGGSVPLVPPLMSPQSFGGYSGHYWIGAEYQEFADLIPWTATTLGFTMTVPMDDNPPPGWFVALLSAWDTAGSYDQIGLGGGNGLWEVAYEASPGACSGDYTPQETTAILQPGWTYTFEMSIGGGTVTFDVQTESGQQVLNQAEPTGGDYFWLDSSYCGDSGTTVYEEVRQTPGPVPPYDFTFSSIFTQSGPITSWTTFAGPAPGDNIPSGIQVYESGSTVTIANEPFYVSTQGPIYVQSGPGAFPLSFSYFHIGEYSADAPIHLSLTSLVPWNWATALSNYSVDPPANVNLSFTVLPDPLPGNYTMILEANDDDGLFTNVTVDIDVLPQPLYTVVFNATGLPTGAEWNATFGVASVVFNSTPGQPAELREPTGIYNYTISAPQGYAANPSSGTVVVESSTVVINVSFEYVYGVTFSERGLANGTFWFVFAFAPFSNGGSMLIYWNWSLYSTIGFDLPNGTYSYQINTTSEYSTEQFGNFTVNGSAVNVPIQFSLVTYRVDFVQMGLAGSQQWYVSVNGTPLASDNGSVAATLPNGTYQYSVGSLPGYGSSPTDGTVVVNGTGQTIDVSFTQVRFNVIFAESGLPSGTAWGVTLNGTQVLSSGTNVSFSRPDGTYAFTVGTTPGYSVSPSSGRVTVSGLSVTRTIVYAPLPPPPLPTYTVTFTETGWPTGTNWSVTVNAETNSSVNDRITFHEPNGSYTFSVNTVDHFSPTPGSGEVVVSGHAVIETISYSKTTGPARLYSVTFTETGLAPGTSWSINIGGAQSFNTTRTSTHTLTLSEQNGTFNFTVGSVPGYIADPSSGTIAVSGNSVSRSIAFTSTQSVVTTPSSQVGNASTGLSTLDLVLLGVVGAVGAAVVAVVLIRRARKDPPSPTPPPGEPSPVAPADWPPRLPP
jgi:hypothetical protein